MAEKQPVPKDPIQTRSLSLPIFIATGILMASVALAGYDEFYGRRPYKTFQKNFQTVYLNYLEVLKPEQEERLKAIYEDADYLALVEERNAAQAKLQEELPPLNDEIDALALDIAAVQKAQKDPKAQLSALRYKLEVAHEDARPAIEETMAEVKARTQPVAFVHGGEREEQLDYGQLEAAFASLSKEKAGLEKRRANLSKPAGDAQKRIDAFVDKHLQGPHPANVDKLLAKANEGLLGSEGKSINDILQIHIGEFDWVDRCESCHAGAREPVDMRPWDINRSTPGDEPVDHAVVFATHPSKDLLKIHDPATFGCSMCHNGNGRSVTSVEYAHGKNKHWLFPLFERHPGMVDDEMGSFESGCVQCHLNDIKLDYRPSDHVATDDKGEAVVDENGALVTKSRKSSFNEGRWLFYSKGCWGCHRYEGVDTQPEELQRIKNETLAIDDNIERLGINRGITEDPAEKARIDMEISSLTTRRDELAYRRGDLERERQKVGPNLKNVRAKVNPDWILPWLLDPASFRPTTKMPTFFQNVSEETARQHATKIAAYLWQNASDRPDVTAQAKGDATRGAALFKERGCLACHTVMDGNERLGDGFAADLSRVGEKANYDFLVRWIQEPDSGVMPNLRLSPQDSRDIASWLMTRKGENAGYPAAPNLDDPALAAEGATLIRHYGCAGCHEIKGMENDGRIGTELTFEGSKPKERLDFGRLEHGFKKAGKYTHQAFFEEKLRYPGVFGRGKVYEDPKELDRLKMPNFRLDEHEISALSTVLLGSIESQIPQTFRYNPDERRKAIQDGWWVVRKYNCIGCHQVEAEEIPKLWSLDQYVGNDDQGAKKSDRRPPSLVGIGFRTNPKWLAEFLRNPAQSRDVVYGNGLRSYLDVRMPTFRFSEQEIQKLVRFFGALDSQAEPYVETLLEPLSDAEVTMARAIFKGVDCNKCHAIGNPQRDAKMNAPDLTWAHLKLKPDWTARWLVDPGAILPGTNMPQNFVNEYEIKLKDGRTIIGVDLNIRKGKGRITDHAKETIRFNGSDLVESRVLRLIVSPIPAELQGYEGDHRLLMMRYLHETYDKSEVPKVTNN
ncbi:MAG: c-type cytochrome [Planctomycetes bacterium]|nr:c-type cytochrome [Planctomycetota bacterium]